MATAAATNAKTPSSKATRPTTARTLEPSQGHGIGRTVAVITGEYVHPITGRAHPAPTAHGTAGKRLRNQLSPRRPVRCRGLDAVGSAGSVLDDRRARDAARLSRSTVHRTVHHADHG